MSSTSAKRDLRYLATDLDGTLIPITPEEATRPGQSAGGLDQETAEKRFLESQAALSVLRSDAERCEPGGLGIVFVTGRHFESVCEAIVEFDLPIPDWILCDVGSRCLQRVDSTRSHFTEADQVASLFQTVRTYDDRLDQVAGRYDCDALMQGLASVASVRPQEAFKQGRHKHSFYCQGVELAECERAIATYLQEHNLPLNVVASTDPFTGDGLIDLMPPGVNKSFALQWWIEASGANPDQIVFAGDSGNDHAAMVSGLKTIIVGNATRELAQSVENYHRDQQWSGRLFLARQPNTVAVLDGCRWFGLIDSEEENLECPSRLDEADLSSAIGATVVGAERTKFVVFAPDHESVSVRIDSTDPTSSSRQIAMHRTSAGYHVAVADQCAAGMLYRIDLGNDRLRPDPSSRFQPRGVHGPSAVIDPSFAWTDADWRGIDRDQLILHEVHIGTFTKDGTFRSAINRLDELVDLGVTGIEVMPVNQCGGDWNWGYDGVNWFAPMASYGHPDDLRAFVDAAHARGLAVYLDVVYNHLGPEGNYLHDFGSYVSKKHQTVWGDAPNFDDGESSIEIRRWATSNVLMWLREFHFDGVRVDAIHCIADENEKHWVREMSEAVTAWRSISGRPAFLIAESNVYDPEMLASLDDDQLGTQSMGFDGQWCDDFLHSVFAVVRPGEQLSNRTYESKTDLQTVLESGFVFEGTIRKQRERRRPADRVDTHGLIYSIQNHDFIGNHPTGQRFHQITSLSAQRAAASLLILSPAIPMIFMGEEFACENPFSFFVDFGDDDLREAVIAGRRAEYPQHDWSGGTLPTNPAAFQASKIGPVDDGCASMRDWYRSLIECRQAWRQSGLLCDQNMSAAFDTDANLYGFSYQSDRQQAGVLVRLATSDVSQSLDSESLQSLLSKLGLPSDTMSSRLDSAGEEFLGRDEDASQVCRAWVFG